MTNTSSQNLSPAARNILGQPITTLFGRCDGVSVTTYYLDRLVDRLKAVLREAKTERPGAIANAAQILRSEKSVRRPSQENSA